MLRHFQLPYLEQQGYVNIRCAWSLGCPAEIKPFAEEGQHRENVHAGGDYKGAFEILFPGKDVPQEVGVSCCAQFAATKEKIRERKRKEYVRWRKWLLDTELGDSISGRVMEYSWHSKFHSLIALHAFKQPLSISRYRRRCIVVDPITFTWIQSLILVSLLPTAHIVAFDNLVDTQRVQKGNISTSFVLCS
jgi:hypothetical protein